MNDAIEDICETLVHLRQNPATKRRFPSETWDAIIQLTKTYSREVICRRLQLAPALLKRKIEKQMASVEFHEIPIHHIPTETIIIELTARNGIRAKIQGPLSCLNCLQQLLGR